MDVFYFLALARLVHFAATTGNVTRQRFLSQVLVRENAYLQTDKLDSVVHSYAFPAIIWPENTFFCLTVFIVFVSNLHICSCMGKKVQKEFFFVLQCYLRICEIYILGRILVK